MGKTMKSSFCRKNIPIILVMLLAVFSIGNLVIHFASAQQQDPLTGNWVVQNPNADGTSRNTYLNLKKDGTKITGSIRVTQFYHLKTENTGRPEDVTLIVNIKDGTTDGSMH